MSGQLVLLADSQGRPAGTCDKLEAHRRGLCHLAFSVFVFDGDHRLLLQKRSSLKYHSGGLWSNTCCSHPLSSNQDAIRIEAQKRLKQEMGFSCPLKKLFSFHYCAHLPNGLIEHEIDTVFAGRYSGAVTPDPDEVEEYRFMNLQDLNLSLQNEPEKYTCWFRMCLDQVLERLHPDLF